MEPVEIIENCQVEWDKRRGVLYVHNKETGVTVVRIGSLPACRDDAELKNQLIDIIVDPQKVMMPDRK